MIHFVVKSWMGRHGSILDKIFPSLHLKRIDSVLIKDIIYDDCEVCEYLIPYSEGKLLNDLNEKSHVLMREYREDGVYIKAEVALSLRRMCEKILWDGAKNE